MGQGGDAIDRATAHDIKLRPVLAAKGQVLRRAGQGDDAERGAIGAEDLHARASRHIDTAFGIDGDAVRATAGAVGGFLEARQLGEVAAVGDTAVRADAVGDERLSGGIGDVERLFIGAERDAVGPADIVEAGLSELNILRLGCVF